MTTETSEHPPAWDMGAASHEQMRQSVEARYAALFEPIQIGPKTAPNRFYSVPYAAGWGMHQINLDREHRRTRAEGGWGVVSSGEVLFSRESCVDVIDTLQLFDDDDARALAPIADGIHEFGALAAIELSHPGALASPGSWRLTPAGPSQIQSDALFFSSAIGREMLGSDIRRVKDDWVTAARRARAAGYDIVYVHCAHSTLPMQFLTPYYNRRADEYGGSLANRSRFLLELLEQLREAVGEDMAIACRFGIEAFGVGGLGIDEACETIALADHLVDLWDFALGGLSTSDRDLTPSRLYEEGASLEWTSKARCATTKPVVGSGRLTDIDLMARVVTSGELDFIGAARPGIADPFLPRKIAAGEFGHIRECIGSNRCAYSEISSNFSCSQNATTGEEHRRSWHPERFTRAQNTDRPVLIVGAGPAGLECATVLARRGFEHVHVVDGEARMGGHMRWFAQLPGFNPWGRVIEHREWLVGHLRDVQFVPGTKLDRDAILDYGAAIVIVATGAPWITVAENIFTGEAISGADAALDHVLTPEQIILEGKRVPDGDVLLYDCQGEHVALGVTQYLQERGHRVTVASPLSEIGARAMQDGTATALRGEILAAGGATVPGVFLTEIGDRGAVVVGETMEERTIDCGSVVLMTRRSSNDSLYRELLDADDDRSAAEIESVFRIGDCVAPQDLADAIFSGHRLAREIDSEDPSLPLPAARV